MTGPSPVTLWLDRFFEEYYAARPVNATFVGRLDHDHRLPDFSENGAGDVRARMDALLRESEALSTAPAEDVARLDVRLARGFLRAQLWEYGSQHFHRGNPSTFTGEAVFAVMGLFLRQAEPEEGRFAAARARLEGVPAFLEEGRRRITQAPRDWTERALRECAGARAFLTDGVACLVAERGRDDPAFRAAAARAEEAFVRFASWLEAELLPRDGGTYACGPEALDLHLREGHFLDAPADELVRYAEAELRAAQAYLREHASDFGARTPDEALAALNELHPQADGYYYRYESWSRTVRERAEALDLLTWPEAPIRFVPQPVWSRSAAPFLYFLPYRAPAPLAWPAVHECLVTPVEAGQDPPELRRRLRANNDAAIKLNYVVHHGGIGHHVQNAHAARAASRIGRVAAVDCASRIALFCGGTMAEGWACYATDLAAEAGLLTPLEQYAERHTRVRMCARTVVDVRLHQGRLTLDEAADYYEREAGMPATAARGEAVKNSMFPGAAAMYLAGTDAIHALRREMSRIQGAAFRLRAFHDELLSFGSVPVTLAAAAMKARGARAEASPC
jgi:hypothetical protein